MELYRYKIQSGREGWVYLIHAEGTDRYKIGRSVDLTRRHQVLQSQSPYPLELISCFHSLDAVTDEGKLHELFAPYQVYREWFQFQLDLNSWVGMPQEEYRKFKSWTCYRFEQDALFICQQLGIDIKDTDFKYMFDAFSGVLLSRRRYKFYWEFTERVIPNAVKNKRCVPLKRTHEYVEGMIRGAFEGLILLYPNLYDDPSYYSVEPSYDSSTTAVSVVSSLLPLPESFKSNNAGEV